LILRRIELKRIYKLLLPISIATVTAHAATKTAKHTIKNGESLYTIAKKNHTTVDALCKLNGIKKSSVLKVGRAIKIPASKNTKIAKHSTKKASHYTIKSGDTLSGIARKNHISLAALTQANHLKKDATLKPGHTLSIPGSSVHHTAKKTRIAKKTTKKSDKRLARALKHAKGTKIARVHVKKSKKFTLSDLVFGSDRFNGKISKKSQRMIEIAKKKLGRRYVWGATGQRNTFDCSGLTSYVCKANGIKIPRRAIEQSKVGKPVKRSELKPGDLIFFDTSKHRRGYVNHVGIYIGNGKFIHASSAKKKVIITSLKKPFYSQRFKGARRVASL